MTPQDFALLMLLHLFGMRSEMPLKADAVLLVLVLELILMERDTFGLTLADAGEIVLGGDAAV